MGKWRSRWRRKSQKPDITTLGLPRLSPSSRSHTSFRGPASSHVVSKGPPPRASPGIHPRDPQRSLLPSSNSAIMSLFASLSLELKASRYHSQTSSTQRGSATRVHLRGSGLRGLQGGRGHFLEKPGGMGTRGGRDTKEDIPAASRASSQASKYRPDPQISSPMEAQEPGLPR